ncbi:MAG TPA: YbhB/YbcL family Raf kinase inhibitor-like protein [Candidatus Edwardsbacteria bacterium]|nr:YbhB/YbcL family Raf kinase inhibitor-like protein [Candidatus Edwardsbacteria bacterium]
MKKTRLALIAGMICIAPATTITAGCARKNPTATSPATTASFALASAAFQNNGTLPAEYTCDGANGGHSPALAWSGAPAGTACFSLMMTTLALDGKKWNWVLYGIPASVTALAESTSGVGTAGLSSDGPERRYYPPCSQGPGLKTYTFTLYALSGTPSFEVPADSVNGPALVAAIGGMILDSCTLSVSYTRPAALSPQQWRDIDARCKSRRR